VPAKTSLPESVIPLFPLRMAVIAANNQRFIEEDIFGFFRSDSMSIPILLNSGALCKYLLKSMPEDNVAFAVFLTGIHYIHRKNLVEGYIEF
jgi:hypothetical protein